jgi:hypothetical protein
MSFSTRARSNSPSIPCRLCGRTMDLIAERAAGKKKVMRTFYCRHCDNTDTIAYDRGEPSQDDAA